MRIKSVLQFCLVTGLIALFSNSINAQSTTYIGQDLNTITTAVPFLQIAPDARSGGMGEAGVSSTPDANSMHWNPAKYSYIENEMGFSLSYSPWLRALVSDINLAYLTGYKKLANNQVVSGSLLYFSLGDITFTDIQGATIGNYRPNEFAISGTYSRMLTKNLSGAVTARFIHSNLTQGQSVGALPPSPGTPMLPMSLFIRVTTLNSRI